MVPRFANASGSEIRVFFVICLVSANARRKLGLTRNHQFPDYGRVSSRHGRRRRDPRLVLPRSLLAMVLLPYVVVATWCALGFIVAARLVGRRSRAMIFAGFGAVLNAPVLAWSELARICTAEPIGAGWVALGMLLSAVFLRVGMRKPRGKGQPFRPYIP